MRHLAPDSTSEQRLAEIVKTIKGAGYAVVEGSHHRRSYVNPITRRVVLRRGALRDPLKFLVPLLGHEGRHVQQQTGPLPARAWWAAKYLLVQPLGIISALASLLIAMWWIWALAAIVPASIAIWMGDKFRGDVEVDAEAVEAVLRYLDTKELYSSCRLGNMRLPYLLMGSAHNYDLRVLEHARRMLDITN